MYPPLALVEAYITQEDPTPKVRRLHLIVVDLKRRRRLANRVSKQLLQLDVVACADQCWNTLPMLCKQDQRTYQLRYVFAYAMDGADLPCYILWPVRTEDYSFWCIDAWKGNWTDVASSLLWVLSSFLMPSAWTQNDHGGLQLVRRWVFLQATSQKMLTSTPRRKANSRSPRDASW